MLRYEGPPFPCPGSPQVGLDQKMGQNGPEDRPLLGNPEKCLTPFCISVSPCGQDIHVPKCPLPHPSPTLTICDFLPTPSWRERGWHGSWLGRGGREMSLAALSHPLAPWAQGQGANCSPAKPVWLPQVQRDAFQFCWLVGGLGPAFMDKAPSRAAWAAVHRRVRTRYPGARAGCPQWGGPAHQELPCLSTHHVLRGLFLLDVIWVPFAGYSLC